MTECNSCLPIFNHQLHNLNRAITSSSAEQQAFAHKQILCKMRISKMLALDVRNINCNLGIS